MRRHDRRGFTLLEVMLAVAILAISLAAVFTAQVGSVKMAQRARMMGFATLLSRCKMGEIEEQMAKLGFPSIPQTESDNCCKDAPIDGFKCSWEIAPIVLPDTMFGDEEDKDGKKSGGAGPLGAGPGATGAGPGASPTASGSGNKGGLTGLLGAAAAALGGNKDGKDAKGEGSPTEASKDGKTPGKDGTATGKDGKPLDKQDPKDALAGDPSRFLAGGSQVDGMTAMAMQLVYPVLKPSFQGQIRRATVTVTWQEGEATKTMDLTQYMVAEQPVPLTLDPNDPNAQLQGGTSTGSSSTGATNPLGTGLIGTPTNSGPGR